MTVALLAWFDGPPPSVAALRSLARTRLAPHRRLNLIPETPAPTATAQGWPYWAPGPEFESEHHVTAATTATAATAATAATGTAPAALEAQVAALLVRPLDPRRPPWQLHLIPAPDGFALLLRAHHALLDGGSLATVLCALLDGSGAGPQLANRGPAPTPVAVPRARQLAWALGDLLPKARPLPFHGPVDDRRAVAFSRVPSQELAAAREALGRGPSPRTASRTTSRNAVFLTATAGALRTLQLTGRFPRLPGVCALVPVDVRTEEQRGLLGNHYATVRVPLPGRRDARRRLAAMDDFLHRSAFAQRARAQAAVVSSRPREFTLLGDAASRYVDSPRYFSLLCSSVATHAGELTLGPARLVGLAAVPPLGPGHPLAVTMVHHNAGAVLTTVADHSHRRLAELLVGLIHDELRSLAA